MVFCLNQKLSDLTTTLYNALFSSVPSPLHFYLRTDAICVHQADPDEKGRTNQRHGRGIRERGKSFDMA
jgi:hypothetical protein